MRARCGDDRWPPRSATRSLQHRGGGRVGTFVLSSCLTRACPVKSPSQIGAYQVSLPKGSDRDGRERENEGVSSSNPRDYLQRERVRVSESPRGRPPAIAVTARRRPKACSLRRRVSAERARSASKRGSFSAEYLLRMTVELKRRKMGSDKLVRDARPAGRAPIASGSGVHALRGERRRASGSRQPVASS